MWCYGGGCTCNLLICLKINVVQHIPGARDSSASRARPSSLSFWRLGVIVVVAVCTVYLLFVNKINILKKKEKKKIPEAQGGVGIEKKDPGSIFLLRRF